MQDHDQAFVDAMPRLQKIRRATKDVFSSKEPFSGLNQNSHSPEDGDEEIKLSFDEITNRA